ncbi:MAG: hypothetical protein ACYCWE_19680 [Eubacteriales bacterium]
MNELTDRLLNAKPWTEYGTRLYLLNQDKNDKEVLEAKKKILAHPLIQNMISEFDHWEDEIVSSHKSAGLLLHKLAFLADIGLTAEDPGIENIISVILKHRTEEGIIKVPVNISAHFGGTGQNTWGWCLCDTPEIVYSLLKFGLSEELKPAIQYLVSLARDNGWGCHVSPELGRFRGPGSKSDPCPYATLLMLKVLAQIPGLDDEKRCGTESLLQLWADSREKHPYMFYMGTDFRKLKAPFIWYDIIHVTEVLSQFERIRQDIRLQEMIALIKSQADQNGFYTPQSEWRAWKAWDFGQKKLPSFWMTFVILRLLKRFETFS